MATGRAIAALRHMGMNGEFNFRGRNPVKIRCCQYLNNVVEQDHLPGERAIALDVGIQDVLQCATCHYRHRAGAEDSQTPVRNSDPMAVESRGDLASRHDSTGRIARAHSWSYRSDNPICTRTTGGHCQVTEESAILSLGAGRPCSVSRRTSPHPRCRRSAFSGDGSEDRGADVGPLERDSERVRAPRETVARARRT